MEGLRQVYSQIKKDYGLSVTSQSFTRILHFYIEPLYVISYVTSNDAALQLYQMELAEPGAGMDCYMEILDDEQIQFLAFLEEAGLESPFAAGRIQDVRETLENALG